MFICSIFSEINYTGLSVVLRYIFTTVSGDSDLVGNMLLLM